jgi:hypothetical protein
MNRRGERLSPEQTNRRNDFDVSFFPEGGNLPEGVLSKVAFKALNTNGTAATITGYLIDETGAEITSVETCHAGMGVFTYLPESGKRYRLKCVDANGLEKLFDLPQSNPRACSLATSMQNDKIMVGIQKSVNAPDMLCYLLIHSRGTVLFFSEWDGRRTISLTTSELPAGVIQFVLFDAQMNPLSERMMFSKNDATEKIEFQTDKSTYQVRDNIVSTLSLTPSLSGRVGEGLFSVAVTDNKDIAVDESTTILSSLLLSSELKGYIENPAYYLQDPVAMDLLMMTHGWRRYNIPEVVQGRLANPQIPFQQYQEITGQVNTINLLNRPNPSPDSEVTIVMKGGGFGVTSTDANGSFVVSNMAFPDSTTFYIQALTAKGSDYNRLTVDNESFPALVYAPQSPFERPKTIDTETKDKSVENAFIAKAEQRAKYEEEIWTITLKEVEITAPRIKKEEPRDQFWINSSSDYTITRETINDFKFSFIKEYLALIPGLTVSVTSSGEFIYKVVPGVGVPFPLIFIDGVELDIEFLNSLPPVAIESIDIIRNATVLGARGAGGIISVTTRRGGDSGPEKQNRVVYSPLGYQKPVEFYAPKYETLAARQIGRAHV